MKISRNSTRLVQPEALGGAHILIPLSSSDLVVPRVHVEVLYAFQAPTPPTSHLESGLREVLCEYREWAGRLSKDENGRPAIDLNDAGVAIIEAEADGPLEHMVPFNPSHLLLELIPVNRGAPELLLIQFTRFTCGGLALGVARHHQVADGEAATGFMSAWALSVQGLPITHSPFHDRTMLMARDPPTPSFDHIEYKKLSSKINDSSTEHSDLAIGKIHFSMELLKKIKVEAAKGAAEGVTYTTFESLLGHLWKCITKARGLPYEEEETRALVAVNARKRLNPPIPVEYFGNVICHACPHTTIRDLLEQPLSFAAGLVHDAIKKINNDYVRSALDFIELQQRNPVQIARTNRTVLTPNLSVTSWVNLPLYKLDFGCGTPLFAGNPFIPFEGLVILAPSYTKDGSIDAVLGLFAPDMAKLENICFKLDD